MSEWSLVDSASQASRRGLKKPREEKPRKKGPNPKPTMVGENWHSQEKNPTTTVKAHPQ